MSKKSLRAIVVLMTLFQFNICNTHAETDSTPDFKKLTPSDIKALETLEAADDYRNARYFPSAFIPLIVSPRMLDIEEALRLYKKVMNDESVNPDLRARAKINYATFYPGVTWLDNVVNTHAEHLAYAKKLMTEVIESSDISTDIKGWAKRQLAQICLDYRFDGTARYEGPAGCLAGSEKRSEQDAIKGFSLLNEVMNDKNLSVETRARAKMQLAHAYLHKPFNTPKKKKEAIDLINEVINDEAARFDLRVEAQLFLADQTASEVEKSQKMLDAYDYAFNESISDKMRIYVKEQLLRFCMNINDLRGYWRCYDGSLTYATPDIDPSENINITKEEALKKAFQLTQELADEISIPLKNRLKYKKELIDLYKKGHSGLSTEEANGKIEQMNADLIETSKGFPREYFELRMQMAWETLESLSKKDKKSAPKIAYEAYGALLDDKSLPIEYQARLRMMIGFICLMHNSEEKIAFDGGSVVPKIRELVNDVIDRPDLPFAYRQGIRIGLMHMYARNCGKKRTENEADIIAEIYQLYDELLNDTSLTDEKKEIAKTTFQELVDKSKGAGK
jgi:hypothetical protein